MIELIPGKRFLRVNTLNKQQLTNAVFTHQMYDLPELSGSTGTGIWLEEDIALLPDESSAVLDVSTSIG